MLAVYVGCLKTYKQHYTDNVCCMLAVSLKGGHSQQYKTIRSYPVGKRAANINSQGGLIPTS
ncbi:hypothetical protein PLANPX_0708 [Lacipirellula parvula]|uniref:Uncharacterized protein n=1 Tax=Lacipirellula parvula TaxID=2650471 RepID=A0A5K7X9T7_9BACT|nr:hypothetical protein PLANPX_0708 [Lacipirellula parvula]